MPSNLQAARTTAALSAVLCFLLSLLASCGNHGSSAAAPLPPPPALRGVSAHSPGDAPNTARVRFDSSGFAAAHVRYRAGDDFGETLPETIGDGPTTLTVLGLLADTDYELELVLTPPEGGEVVEKVVVRTAPLPSFLADEVRFETRGDTDGGGYFLTDVPTSRGRVVVAFDPMGRVRWFFFMPGLGNFSDKLPNGNFAAFVGTTIGWQPTYGWFAEIAPTGEIVARHQAPFGFYTDEHELLLTPSPRGWYSTVFTYDIRTVDMRRYGGREDARLAAHQIARFDPDGRRDFFWNGWDHIGLDELVESIAGLKEADIDHPNSLAVDHDGHYIVSFRNLSQVMKIDSGTGQVLWRFGGRRNEFTVVDDPLGGFSAQHCARIVEDGHLLLFDNGTRHRPQQSRAVEYALDVPTRTARMVFEYRPDPPIYAAFTGSVQRLSSGNTVVGFAYVGIVHEVDPTGQLVFEGRLFSSGQPGFAYRILRIASLAHAALP